MFGEILSIKIRVFSIGLTTADTEPELTVTT